MTSSGRPAPAPSSGAGALLFCPGALSQLPLCLQALAGTAKQTTAVKIAAVNVTLTEFPKPRIVISKCIGFDACRFNGEIVHDPFVRRLQPHVEFVDICPEVEIGLGTPRDSVRIISKAGVF